MLSPEAVRGMTYREFRTLVAGLPRTPEVRQAQGAVRRRALGLYRERPPLPFLLYLADQEGRLVWRSAEAFAIVEPPLARQTEWYRVVRNLPGSTRALGRLVRSWRFIPPFAPAVVGVVAAVPLGLLSPATARAAVLLLLAGIAHAVTDMIVGVIRLGWSLLRSLSVGMSDDEIFGDEIRGHHWTITFCHAVHPSDADGLCADAFRRTRELRGALLPEDPAFGSECVGVRPENFTSPDVRSLLGDLPSLRPLPRAGWYMIGAKQHFERPVHEAVRPLSGIRLMSASTLLALIVSAQSVAWFERQACSTNDCGARPVTFPKALAWTVRHVFLQFPAPATLPSQALGVLALILVWVMTLCVILTLRWRIRNRRARRDLMYTAIERMAAEPTVAIVVVNETECRAVADAFVARMPGMVPRPGKAGAKAVTLLGTIGGAKVVLAQSEQGTVGAGSMPWTVDNLIKHLDPVFLVLTGVGYGLNARELDDGDQQIGDVVVATQVRAADHRKVTTRADGTQYEITRGPLPEAASDLLSHARVLAQDRSPKVHFGPLLSLNTLVNSEEERARLRGLDEEAVAGEMEAAGLYAAAAQTRRAWIVVKGISDWGIRKTDDHQALAARNAADFVADLICQIEPGAATGREGRKIAG
ncbi:hypothetical protein ACQP1P_08685 [Dactylosporangium sp. CA-052675]|uniref:5'-methylthioadenosine/S-adenosylhomocysteine nucleosidase family protein n=1 Tax=Dactylosporangium sp. CA-052675 TaxID=3239927 RepID=UPI003D904317